MTFKSYSEHSETNLKTYAPINVRPAGGGRRGKGLRFDEKVCPVWGEFDDQYSPGGRGI
jgi:hypothetical protein